MIAALISDSGLLLYTGIAVIGLSVCLSVGPKKTAEPIEMVFGWGGVTTRRYGLSSKLFHYLFELRTCILKKVKASHTRYRALGPELIPV